jgi:hypothetical protein
MTADDIREAVAAGDYAGASAWFEAYAKTLPPTAEALAALANLLHWTTETAACARAQAQARIQEYRDDAHAAAAYSR